MESMCKNAFHIFTFPYFLFDEHIKSNTVSFINLLPNFVFFLKQN